MSNPTLATKLITLVKGIFGRKDPVVTTVQDKKDETPATETVETTEVVETVEVTTEAPAEKADEESAQEKPASEEAATKEGSTEAESTGDKSEDEPEAPVAEAPTKASDAEVAEATETAETAEVAETTETAKLVEEPRGESSSPATADVPEDGSALAEEMEAAEAHTTVASDDVLEKVRKEAAPAAEELAVPTYDELTLPSVRARLRKLTIEQVRDLRAYEVAHQGRPEFIKMFDNRIAKLEAEV